MGRWRRVTTSAVAWIALAAPLAWSYYTYGRYDTSASPNALVPARYDVAKLPNSTLTFYLNDQKPDGMAPGDALEALVSEIAAATAVWSSVSTSSLRLNFGGFTKETGNIVPPTPMGVIRFTSDVPPGAAATGGLRYTIPSGTPNFLPASVSMISLPADMSQTNSSSDWFLATLVHEMGHALGAKHSAVSSLMFQSHRTTRARLLLEDDVAMISLLYPAPGYLSSVGAISGRVTKLDGRGASVVAVSAFSETAVIGAYTNPDGSFTIGGLPPGDYRLMVQPLMLGAVPNPKADNPGDPADLIDCRTLSGAVVTINTDIESAFFAGGGGVARDPSAAAVFGVRAGRVTSNADVIIASRGASRLEAYTNSSYSPAGRSEPQIWITAGGQVSANSIGRGLDAPGLNIAFTNSGISMVAGSLRRINSPDTIFPTAVNYRIQATPGAALGSSSAIFTNGADMYFLPGQVQVVATDPPQITGISPTSGQPGTAVTITGRNFSDADRVYFDGMFTPVISRSAGTLVVRAPQGAGGRVASVFVANPDGQGSEFMGNPPTFTYQSALPPSLIISPAIVVPGQSLVVRVTGLNTNFQQGVTALGFGSGDVVVDSITVNSPTSLVASVRVLPTVSGGSFPVTAVTGEEIAYRENALTLALQPPFALRPYSGWFQAGAPGSKLPAPLVVRAQDSNGVSVPGVTVSFTVGVGGGSVAPTTAVTDASGLAATAMTLGTAAGFQIVVATADGVSTTGIMVIAGGSAGLALTYRRDGDRQAGLANSELARPLALSVTDNLGNILAGVPVDWQVSAGDGIIRPLATITDRDGAVSAIWTLGPVIGDQTVRAIPLGGFNGTVFTATAQAGQVWPTVPARAILNGAGFDSAVAALSPGAIASVFGSNLSAAPASGALPGLFPGTSNLAVVHSCTRVTFDSIPAPLFFVHPLQLNVQVPFEMAGKTSAQVVVNQCGNASPPVTVALLPASPALFTVNSDGKSPAVALNQDGSQNLATNAAARGSVLQLYATGLGAVAPPVATGRLAPASPLAYSVDYPTVTIGGSTAAVEFSGLAPGFAGLWQVNVRVPADSGTGAVQLLLRAGGQNANPVTVFVK